MHEITPGGHAIMLAVEVPEELTRFAKKWIREDHRRKLKLDDPHVTIVFVGRDLPVLASRVMRDRKLTEVLQNARIPAMLKTTGALTIFGAKRDTLVARIADSEALSAARRAVMQYLQTAGLKLRTDWAYNPHVTLATGEQDAVIGEYSATPTLALAVNGADAKIGDEMVSIYRQNGTL